MADGHGVAGGDASGWAVVATGTHTVCETTRDVPSTVLHREMRESRNFFCNHNVRVSYVQTGAASLRYPDGYTDHRRRRSKSGPHVDVR